MSTNAASSGRDSGQEQLPPVKVLHFAPSRIPARHAAELRWYFSDPPIAAVRESSFGALLDKVRTFFGGCRPCRRCGGKTNPWKAGTGMAPLELDARLRPLVDRSGRVTLDKRPYKVCLQAYRECAAKNAGFLIVKTDRAVDVAGLLGVKTITADRAAELWPDFDPAHCGECRACGMLGVVPTLPRATKELTARPTGSSKHGLTSAHDMLDEHALLRYGLVGKTLRRVGATNDVAPAILRAYYEADGGDDALWAFTPSGKHILEIHPNPKLTAAQIIQEERVAQTSKPLPARAAIHASAARDANELFGAACQTWNAVTRTMPEWDKHKPERSEVTQ